MHNLRLILEYWDFLRRFKQDNRWMEAKTVADKVTADIGFEKQIWNAACVLRGNMDASE